MAENGTNGSAVTKVEVRFEREDVLELQLMEERQARMGVQMQVLQQQANALQTQLQQARKEKQELLERLKEKYGTDVSEFAIDLDTLVGTGMAAADAAPASK